MKKITVLFVILFAFAVAKAQTTEEYIANHAEYAQKLMRVHQLPASLILGIAIHESAAGKSKIAKHLNNHFGFKGPNSNTEIRSAYRDFPDVNSSYNHFVTFLQSRSKMNILFDKYGQYDYYGWVKGIQRGGYAHSRTWASQVISLIRKYELFLYDERPEGYVEPERPAVVAMPKKKTTRKTSNFYTVKKSDNLSKLAERNGTTAGALMKKNGLKSAALQPGQKLKL